MSIISTMRRQVATLWEIVGRDDYGQPLLSAPVQIKCRWQGGGGEYVTGDGTPFVAAALVFPDRVVSVGAYLWLGAIGTAPADPLTTDGVVKVRVFQAIPNLKNKETLYKAVV